MALQSSAFTPHGLDPDDYEELRLAVVMNGGVSLAVWIGGVTHEINRAVRADGIYGDLLALTATRARVDIISGTSAGGINGALLALARVYDVDLAPVRDLWIDKGALDRLLRQPYESSPPSLLQGDGRFLPDLQAAFDNVLKAGHLQSASAVPIDLTLTTTVLHGESATFSDDLGQLVTDVTHRGRFRFRRGPHLTDDPFKYDQDIAARLAFAARATASFPVAFEPVFCTVGRTAADGPATGPDMQGTASFAQSRFVVDGGILDNKPLEAALDAIRRQRADREIRRVLAYIVPAPGESAAETADDPAEVPTAGTVALASLITLPRVESISRELATLVEHNANVRRRRETRAALVHELGPAGMRPLATQLFGMYQRRRRLGAAEYIATEVADALAQIDEAPRLGRRGREWLVHTIEDLRAVPWVPTAIPAPDAQALEEVVEHWHWGSYTVEHMAELLIELFRRALVVSPLRDASAAPLRQRLKRWLALSHELAAAIPGGRQSDRGFWGRQARDFATAFEEPATTRSRSLTAWLERAVVASTGQTRRIRVGADLSALSDWPLPAEEVPVSHALGWLAWTTSRVIAQAAPDLRAAAAAGMERRRTRDDWRAADDLRAYIDYLAPTAATSAIEVLEQLLCLEVVQYAVGAHRERDDRFAELVQISADASHPIGGPTSARRKLAGAQLANFGGFYKRSWRANDWMFGRLDASKRLALVLLNPARLARLYPNDIDAVFTGLKAIAVPADAPASDVAYLTREWDRRADAIRTELGYLTDPGLPVPEQLPECANAVLRRHQIDIVRRELPVVVATARDDRAARAYATDASTNLFSAVSRAIGSETPEAWQRLEASTLVSLFASCQIGEERLAGEVGAERFTSHLTRTLAVATSLLSGQRGGLGIVGTLLKTFRLPLVLLDAVNQNAMQSGPTAAFVSGAAWAGSLAVALLALFTSVLPASVEVGGTVLFVSMGAVALRRHGGLVLVWLVLAALMVLAARVGVFG